jgi:hypothetical protein
MVALVAVQVILLQQLALAQVVRVLMVVEDLLMVELPCISVVEVAVLVVLELE